MIRVSPMEAARRAITAHAQAVTFVGATSEGFDFAYYYMGIVFDYEWGRTNFRPSVCTAYRMWRGLALLIS